MCREGFLDDVYEIVRVELTRREIDAHREHHLPLSPAGQLRARLLEDVTSHVDDHSALLERGEEVRREQKASFRVLPPQKCLDSGHLETLQLHDRLVYEEELICLDC